MKNSITCNATNHAGFISTRLAGTDGVSLETTKWARIFEKEGYKDIPLNDCEDILAASISMHGRGVNTAGKPVDSSRVSKGY